MKKFRSAICFISLTTLVCLCEAAQSTLTDAACVALLAKKCIHIKTGGRFDIPFQAACAVLNRDHLLTEIQTGYAELLSEDEVPEFIIHQMSTNQYYYRNRHQQETVIKEVLRIVEKEYLALAFYSKGQRSFGEFESICLIEVQPDGADSVTYSITVDAYPDSAPIRFFSRLAPIKAYFKRKTRDMTELSLGICQWIHTETQRKKEHKALASVNRHGNT